MNLTYNLEAQRSSVMEICIRIYIIVQSSLENCKSNNTTQHKTTQVQHHTIQDKIQHEIAHIKHNKTRENCSATLMF